MHWFLTVLSTVFLCIISREVFLYKCLPEWDTIRQELKAIAYYKRYIPSDSVLDNYGYPIDFDKWFLSWVSWRADCSMLTSWLQTRRKEEGISQSESDVNNLGIYDEADSGDRRQAYRRESLSLSICAVWWRWKRSELEKKRKIRKGWPAPPHRTTTTTWTVRKGTWMSYSAT